GQRPAEQHQHLEKSPIGHDQLRRVAEKVNPEHRIDDRLNGKRHELKRFEGLVSQGEPTDLGKRAELLEENKTGPKIEVGEKKGEGEGQSQWQPAPYELAVEAQSDPAQVEDVDDDQRIDDRERVRRGVSPDVIADARVPARAENDKARLDQRLGNDRDRVELSATDRVERVAKEARVCGSDQKCTAREDERREARAESEGNRKNDRRKGGQRRANDDQSAEVVAELSAVARGLPRVQRLE